MRVIALGVGVFLSPVGDKQMLRDRPASETRRGKWHHEATLAAALVSEASGIT